VAVFLAQLSVLYGEPVDRLETTFQALRERHFVGRGEERDATDLTEVETDRVCRLRVLLFEDGLLDASGFEQFGFVRRVFGLELGLVRFGDRLERGLPLFE